jgi:hypothetical protein
MQSCFTPDNAFGDNQLFAVPVVNYRRFDISRVHFWVEPENDHTVF